MAAFRPTTASRRVKTLIPTRRNVHSLQCAGITRRGARCSRRITASNLPGRSGKTNTASYCKIHLRINLNATSSSNLPRAAKKGPFKAHVPPYVGAHACKSICDALSKGPSPADEPGAIYAFEVHDTSRPNIIRIKVGRTNDIVRRYKEHRRRCPSLQPTLLGYYPSNGESLRDLAAGRLRPIKKTPSSHLLERVVHLELADVAVHAPYLSPNGVSGGLHLGATQVHRACQSCGSVHKEIFTFKRLTGASAGNEWKDIILPIITRYAQII